MTDVPTPRPRWRELVQIARDLALGELTDAGDGCFCDACIPDAAIDSLALQYLAQDCAELERTTSRGYARLPPLPGSSAEWRKRG